jgi:putative ABC transport system substrate-binding protein
MRRREFIGLVGGAAVWPAMARAQQAAMPVIGFVRNASLADATYLVVAFRNGLKEAGFVEGQNVAIELRSAEGENGRLPALVSELIRRPVAVFVGNTSTARVIAAARTTIPIVFASGSDPVRDGLVASLNRPGGNATGVVFFSSTLGAKRLELLRQLVPKATTIAVLVNQNEPEMEAERKDVLAAAQKVGQKLIVHEAKTESDIEAAFTTFVQHRVGALYVGAGPFMNSHRELIVALAARHQLATSHAERVSVEAGALMSYSTSISDAYRQVGVYAGRILKGEKAADLPVMQATKFELVINLKTAKALGLSLPQAMLVAADEVIE